METLKHLLFIFSIVTVLTSCEKERLDDCFKGHGSDETEVRSLPPFNEINISGNVVAELIPDTAEFVEVTGGKNFIDQIKTEVSNNQLEIYDNISCKFVRSYDRDYTVKVHFTSLRYIEHYGSKSLTSTDTIREDILDIDKWAGGGDVNLLTYTNEVFIRIHAGSGDVTVKGRSNFQYSYQRGFGFMMLNGLFSDEIYVDKGGTGDCFIFADRLVDIEFDSEGNLYIYGDPPTVNVIRKKRDGAIVTVP